MKDKALVVLSGGQDSTTCLFWAKQNFKEVSAITFDYNQRNRREIEAASLISSIAGVKVHHIVKLGPILQGKSPLTNPDQQLEMYDNFEQMNSVIGDRIEHTFVPMRNSLFLTIAANYAYCNDIYDVVTGVCQAGNVNYPDCGQSFLLSQEETIEKALGLWKAGMEVRFRIHTPLMYLAKHQSVQLAIDLGAYIPIAFSHTSYDGCYPPKGKDRATTLRAHGFLEAMMPDPLVVRAWSEGLMDLPNTPNYWENEVLLKVRDEIDSLKLNFNFKE